MKALLYALGTVLRAASAAIDPHAAQRRRAAQRAHWKRITAGDGLPPKVREYLEGL